MYVCVRERESGDREMEFVEGNIAEEKVFGGVVFPKTLQPPLADGEAEAVKKAYGACELVEMIKAKREWLYELFQRHSAILFRGFDLSSPEDFGQVVEAFGWKDMSYLLFRSRSKLADRVYTTDDFPIDQHINFHHEMALMKQFPSKILFFCLQPSPKNGETSILPSYILVEKMEETVPEFMIDLKANGFIYRKPIPKGNGPDGKTWKWILGTDDQFEAEKRAKKKSACSAVNFNEDGSAEFVYGPMSPIKEFEGRKVWFFTINGYTVEEGSSGVGFGDGRRFPVTAMDAYKKITEKICVDVKWEKGDVLLVDNLCVQHARRPGEPPRNVLVSIC